MDITEEKKLVAAFLDSRSENDFISLYNLYAHALYRMALRLYNGDGMAAEDVVQETWIRALEKLHQFRWQSSLKTWLTGILINCTREAKRKSITNDVHEGEVAGMIIKEIDSGRVIDIKRAISLLPHGYKEILLLHDFEGYRHKEIGEMLGISEGTSKSQLFNARNTIKKLLN